MWSGFEVKKGRDELFLSVHNRSVPVNFLVCRAN